MTDLVWESSLDFTIYDKTTGFIVMAGHNKPRCVELDCAEGQGILYEHSVPIIHYVDVSGDAPAIRLKPEHA